MRTQREIENLSIGLEFIISSTDGGVKHCAKIAHGVLEWILGKEYPNLSDIIADIERMKSEISKAYAERN